MTDPQPVRILGFCGSLRRASFNAGALRAARDLAPDGVEITIADIRDLPLYDDDLRQQGLPAAVEKLGVQLRGADAILFASPEYNYSVSSVLKTAIDWISRLPDRPYQGLPGALLGASPGMIGTARAQHHLRQICVFLDIRLLNKPEVMIGGARERFDEDGNLTDEETGRHITALVTALRDAAQCRRQAVQNAAS